MIDFETRIRVERPIDDVLAAVLGPLAARAVRRGVDANFAALKLMLEAGTGDA